MAVHKNMPRSMQAILGAATLVLGFLLLFVNVDTMSNQVSRVVGAPVETVGFLPALGLASLHLMHAYSFEHAAFVSSLAAVLLSFWPLVLIYMGAVVLRRALARPSGAYSSWRILSVGGSRVRSIR